MPQAQGGHEAPTGIGEKIPALPGGVDVNCAMI